MHTRILVYYSYHPRARERAVHMPAACAGFLRLFWAVLLLLPGLLGAEGKEGGSGRSKKPRDATFSLKRRQELYERLEQRDAAVPCTIERRGPRDLTAAQFQADYY